MAEYKLTIPDDKVQLVTDALCSTQGYTATIEDDEGNVIANISKVDFAKNCIIWYIKSMVKLYERKLAEASITNTDINIT